jgi:hypothetical protein
MYVWYKFPYDIPDDNQVCWIRVNYYYGTPFLAIYNRAAETFVSNDNSITFPAYMVARWYPFFSSELIKNGSFDGSTDWELFGDLYVSANKLWIPGTDQYDCRQLLSLSSGHNYKLDFTIGDLSGQTEISFTDDSFFALFGGTFPNGSLYSAGSHSVNVTTAISANYFNFYLLPDDYPMSITGISLMPR